MNVADDYFRDNIEDGDDIAEVLHAERKATTMAKNTVGTTMNTVSRIRRQPIGNDRSQSVSHIRRQPVINEKKTLIKVMVITAFGNSSANG